MCNRLMRLKRKISLLVGGLAIDLSCKLTVVLSTDTSRKAISRIKRAACFIPFRAKLSATNSTSRRPNGNSMLDSEKTKKLTWKMNIPRNLHSPNIVYNLVTLSRRNRLQYYVLTQVGEQDAS